MIKKTNSCIMGQNLDVLEQIQDIFGQTYSVLGQNLDVMERIRDAFCVYRPGHTLRLNGLFFVRF